MMTPEEAQRTMEFILTSHANSAVRMARIEQNIDRLAGNIARLEDNVTLLQEEQGNQKETVGVMVKITQDLLEGMQIVAHPAKRLEARSDSVDEMIKVLRELLERGLRRPDDSRQE